MDGRRIFDQVIIDIEVTPGNQAPTDILISNLSVTENAPNDTLIGELTTIDPDSQEFTYAIFDQYGDPLDNFKIVDNQLQVADTTQLDFETESFFEIIIKSTDNRGLSIEETFTVELIDDRDFDITGTEEDDFIESGIGGEVITGLGGKDTFAYDNVDEFGDILTDFNAENDDIIDVSGLYYTFTDWGYDLESVVGQTPFEDLITVTGVGNENTQVFIRPYGQIYLDYLLPLATLEGVTPAQIDANDFIFS